MNILEIFAAADWGGGEQFVFDLSETLIEKGNQVVCVSKKSEVIVARLVSLKCNYFVLPMKGVFDFYSAFFLRRIIQKNNIQIIHVHDFKTLFPIVYGCLFLKSKPKIIVSRHLAKKAKTNCIYHRLYHQIDTLIFVSDFAKQKFLSTHPKIDLNKCIVIHNSIKEHVENESINFREKFNLEESTAILAFTGRLVKEKGVHVLIRALALLKSQNFILLIAGVGDSAYRQELENIIFENQLEEKVKFLGFVKNITSLVQQAHIGIFPSIQPEAFGLSIIEFMKEGKAVIASDNGAQPEFITPLKTGILVKPNDSTTLTEQIDFLLSNPVFREQLGAAGKTCFENRLSYPQFYEKITDAFNIKGSPL